MTKEEIYSVWAPAASVWSPWVKPVLFAHLDAFVAEPARVEPVQERSWIPEPSRGTALVLELAGASGVPAGLATASRGYHPVPLYNALPLPAGHPNTDAVTGQRLVAVDTAPILQALRQTAEALAQLPPDAMALPAFLLDANRHGDRRILAPEAFDNRSICFTTDFPSAVFLQAHGVRAVRWVRAENSQPASDLAHVLRRWQDGGLRLERATFVGGGIAEPFSVDRPAWYGRMFQRALAAFGLRQVAGGGFGDWLPGSGG